MIDLEEILAGPKYLNEVPEQIYREIEFSVQSSLLFVFYFEGFH